MQQSIRERLQLALLSAMKALAIIRKEAVERRQAAAEYDRLGQPETAERLRSEANVLGELLA